MAVCIYVLTQFYSPLSFYAVKIVQSSPCRHRISSNIWRSLRLESHGGSSDKTMEKALQLWMKGDGTNEAVIRWKDDCTAPHCNDECPEHIVLSTLSTLWETQYMLAVCISVLALSLWCALIRIILQFSRYRLAKSQKQFIEDLANNPYREETLDVSNIYDRICKRGLIRFCNFKEA